MKDEASGTMDRQEKRSTAQYEGEDVTKKAGIVLVLAILVSLVLSIPALASPSFSDVPNDSVFYEYVTALAERGIVSGFPDGSFHPYDFITRQQLAKMIVLATHTPIEEVTSIPTFTDLSPDLGRPYPYDYVVAMVVRAAQKGRPEFLLGPGEQYNESPLGDFDPTHAPNWDLARFNGLFGGLIGYGKGDPWQPATRGEVAQILWNLQGLLEPQ